MGSLFRCNYNILSVKSLVLVLRLQKQVNRLSHNLTQCSLFVCHLHFLYYTYIYIVLICLPILREFHFKFIFLNTIELFHNSKRVGSKQIILSASHFEI